MHKHLKNTKKSYRRSAQNQIFMLIGFLWILATLLLFLNTAITSAIMNALPYSKAPITELIFLTLVFFIGGFGISYSIVNSEPNKTQENRRNLIVRAVWFALGIAIASMVVYFWVHLFINGL